MFAGQVKIVSHSSCRTSAILKGFIYIFHVNFNISRDHRLDFPNNDVFLSLKIVSICSRIQSIHWRSSH